MAPTQETLALMIEAQGNGTAPNFLDENLRKAWTVSSGLVNYDLEAPSKKLFPTLAPLRNLIPRVRGNGDTATRWKAVTAINTANVSAGVSEGNRGAVITNSTASYTSAYQGLGLEDTVTFEADYAGQGFEDVRATAALLLLESLMIQEEYQILGGNNSLALGTTPTPVPSTSTTGGTIAAATYDVICVALTMDGYRRASVGATGITQTFIKTNADSSTDTINGGCAQKSATATQATTGATSTLSATVTPVAGAFAYAWYVGTAGAAKIAAITTVPSFTITALPSGGNQAASALTAADYSQNSTHMDGLLTYIAKGGGAYLNALTGAGTTLTSDGAGGIAEFSTAFQSFFDNFRLSPDTIWVNSAQMKKIKNLVVANGGAPLVRYTSDLQGNHAITAGAQVLNIVNEIMGNTVSIKVHPYLPAGTAMFTSSSLPYKLADVPQPVRIKTRQEYYQVEWPRRSRKYEYGVYVDELLQVYAPFSLGMITGIA